MMRSFKLLQACWNHWKYYNKQRGKFHDWVKLLVIDILYLKVFELFKPTMNSYEIRKEEKWRTAWRRIEAHRIHLPQPWMSIQEGTLLQRLHRRMSNAWRYLWIKKIICIITMSSNGSSSRMDFEKKQWFTKSMERSHKSIFSFYSFIVDLVINWLVFCYDIPKDGKYSFMYARIGSSGLMNQRSILQIIWTWHRYKSVE